MTRLKFIMSVLMALLGSVAPLRAHEVFRFVGFITRWDPKKQTIDMQTREVWDGKTGDYMRHLVLREECRVMRLSQEVKRSELKVGQYVVVDAAGVDINDLEATEIEIKPLPPPKKKK
jgi:hypothetical protein